MPVAAAIVLAIAAGGCQLPGLVMSNLPRGKVPAVYEPPDRPTVVLVDDPDRHLPSIQYPGLVAGGVASDLKRAEAITRFIPPHRVDALRMDEEGFDSWSIAKIGRRLGARQVIYVRIENFQLSSVPRMYRPLAAARVKVIDVRTGRRLFPAPHQPARKVLLKMDYRSRGHGDEGAASTVLSRRLADQLGGKIANLFYDHDPRRVGSGPAP